MNFIALLLLIPLAGFAQLNTGTGSNGACIHDGLTSFLNTPGPYNCSSLTISSPLSTADVLVNNPNQPLIIRVTGNVNISSSIGFQGQPGVDTTGGSLRTDGGLGGGDGGGWTANSEAGLPGTRGGRAAGPVDCGLFGPGDEAEGGGGGGGSLIDAGGFGLDGTHLAGTAAFNSTGGDEGTVISNFQISSFTFAGAGGASGESGCNPGAVAPGTGGGGGGGLQIIAGGTVTITGSINVFGGDGGAGAFDAPGAGGGGGGGGSGGIVVIQSLREILLASGIINATGGDGGAGGNGSDGGDGGVGIVILEDLDGIVDISGVTGPTPIVRPVSTGSSTGGKSNSLNSDISCGTIAKNDDHMIWNVSAGFALSLLLAFLARFASRTKRYLRFN